MKMIRTVARDAAEGIIKKGAATKMLSGEW